MIYQGPSQFVSIIGLPRSGTSIISRTIHSAENAFCISEPLHRLGAERIYAGRELDKIGPVHAKNYGEIIPAIYELWNDPFNPWQIGGVKEVDVINAEGTFTRWDQLWKSLMLFKPVFIHRHPFNTFDAWKRSEFKTRGLNRFIDTCLHFKEMRETCGKDYAVISYEHFCNDPQAELNRAFPGEWAGPIGLQKMDGEMGPMDLKAKGSNAVQSARQDYDLTKDEKREIEKHCL